MASSAFAFAILAIGVSTAAAIDLKTRRVPNVLTLTLIAAGVASAAAGLSGVSVKAALLGLSVGFAVMLPGHLFGGTGAGDVKLFAGVGSLLGVSHTLTAFLYTALAGGAFALCVAMHRRRLTVTVQRTGRFIGGGGAADIEHPQANNRFAYAPAIAAGSLLAALGV